jgi:DNA-binding winged helix-turn-helix (wHTH) protein
MLVSTSLDIKSRSSIVIIGAGVVLMCLIFAGIMLFLNLPDANVFNDRVEQIFTENEALTSPDAIKLLEVLAQSGTVFAHVLTSYRMIIFILMVLASALLFTSLYFLVTNQGLQKQMGEVEKSGMVINSLIINREERVVYINTMEFELTNAVCETLAVLCEARLDDDVVTGLELESMISGKNAVDCDEATGTTRIKRLRDHLGNQMISHLLVKNISRKGYMLAVDKDVIKMI